MVVLKEIKTIIWKMIFKLDWVTNKSIKRYLEHGVFLIILVVLIPYFLYFEVTVVLPTFAEQWSISYFVHMTCITFLLINVVGNMVYGMSVNSTIKGKILNSEGNLEHWSLCSVCETMRPPRAWHCDICDICVLKRDHHCSFLAACIGYHNQRYYMLFVFHIFCAMVYAFCYNVQFLYHFIAWNNRYLIIKFVLPLACIAFDNTWESLYIFIVLLNFIIGAVCATLLVFHLKNILKGVITPEIKHLSKEMYYDYGWKLNIIEVFGKRWYLTWLSPFIRSPLPGNGITWAEVNKQK